MVATPHQETKILVIQNFDKHTNTFGKGWLPGSGLITGTRISTLTTLKLDLSNHPFIKDDIFEVTVNSSPRGNPIGIIVQ